MSADDWIACPFCKRKFDAKAKELKDRLELEYGRMPARDYDTLKAETDKEMRENEAEREEGSLLRVDGVHSYGFDEDGNFTTDMRAECPHCGRKWRITEKAPPEE